jgi:hypothetical protein
MRLAIGTRLMSDPLANGDDTQLSSQIIYRDVFG